MVDGSCICPCHTSATSHAQCGQRFTLESKHGPLYTLARGEMAWGGGPGPFPWSTGSGRGSGSGSSRVGLSNVVAPNYVRYHVSMVWAYYVSMLDGCGVPGEQACPCCTIVAVALHNDNIIDQHPLIDIKH